MDEKIFFPPLLVVLLDPGYEIRDPGWIKIRIREKHPGSATRFVSGFEFKAKKIRIPIQRLMWCLPVRNGTATLTLGSAVGGRVSFNSNDDHDAMDGELVCRVLQLMQLTDNRLTQVTGSYRNMVLGDAKIH